MSWMSSLRKCGAATDWAVVIVEPADTKKANKLLPRTSVLDKLKTDVGGKQPERCMSLIGEQSRDVQWQKDASYRVTHLLDESLLLT